MQRIKRPKRHFRINEAARERTIVGISGIIPDIGTVSNIGARDSQQDSFGISDKGLYREKGILAIVADGMGGLENGGEASRIAASVGLECFKSEDMRERPHISLLNMVFQANRNVLKLLNSGGELSGSTFVAAYVYRGAFNFISVGDSRIYLHRGGSLIMMNREQVYSRSLDLEHALGRISIEEALNDRQRKSLTDFIGKEDLDVADYNIGSISLLPGDGILLMSDGVFNTLSEERIAECIYGRDAGTAMSHLQREVLNARKSNQDNFTCVYMIFG